MLPREDDQAVSTSATKKKSSPEQVPNLSGPGCAFYASVAMVSFPTSVQLQAMEQVKAEYLAYMDAQCEAVWEKAAKLEEERSRVPTDEDC